MPSDGSAERLFETVSDDPGATLVQLINAGSAPVTSAACTTHHFILSNHPTPDTIDDVVAALSPVHVVITHQQGAAANQYKDKNAMPIDRCLILKKGNPDIDRRDIDIKWEAERYTGQKDLDQWT